MHSRYALLAVTVLAVALGRPALAADHACAADAVGQAKRLLRFHLGDTAPDQIGDGVTAKVVAPVRTLKGNRELDVLEVTSDVYKASYRMRFIYARIPGSCALMGQEILEAGNPY